MANKKITAYTGLTTPSSTDTLAVVDISADETKKITYANLTGGATQTELGYVSGVTSAIQTQIDAKQAVVSGVSSTEIGYLDGVTSAIQTQLSGKLATGLALLLTGGTMTGTATLVTGTTTVAPIKFVAGTNLTTPVAGVVEFDGTDFYITI